ncbi:MAG: hypothetical protein HDS82_06100 [Bacteroidales bacterium]|nr:hypothetical protein [Bacteroidales bacterium]
MENNTFYRILYSLLMLVLSGVSLQSAEIIRTLDFNPSLINEKSLDKEGQKGRCEVLWEGLEPQSKEGLTCLPVYYLSIEVPVISGNYRVAIDSYVTSQPIRMSLPIGVVINRSVNLQSDDIESELHFDTVPEYKERIDVEIVNDYYIKGLQHFVTVRVNPLELIDERTIVPCESITLSLTYDEDGIDPLSFTKRNSINRSISSNVSQNFLYKSDNPDLRSDYIIITTEDLKDDCRNLAIWKAQKGMNVILKTIEEIASNITDCIDTAETIRKYLQSLYVPTIDQYCILIGPFEKLPARYFYRDSSREGKEGILLDDNFVPSDIYYSDLIQNWQFKKDIENEYTESIDSIKFSPCLFVGRLICQTSKEIENYLHKLYLYEAFPGKGDTDYLNNALLTKQDQQLTYKHLFEELNDFSLIELRDISETVSNKDAITFDTNKPTGRQVIEMMKTSGIISLQGHGNPGTVACAGVNGKAPTWRYIKALDYYDNKKLGYCDVGEPAGCGLDNLNNIWTPSIIYSLSCDIMPFDRVYNFSYPYTMGTSYTVAGLYGGVAMLGNTRLGYTAQGPRLELNFGKQIKCCSIIGKAQAFSKTMSGFMYYAIAASNILGDPQISLWLGKPKSLNIALSSYGGGMKFESDEIVGAKISLFNDEGVTLLDSITHPTYEVSANVLNMLNYDLVVSIWREGYLPFVKYFGQNKTLKTNKRYIVNQAVIGKQILSNLKNGNYIVGTGSVLSISALDEVKLEDGFGIENGGMAEFDSMNVIEVKGTTVNSGGKLDLNADRICIGAGFKAEKGGILNARPKGYSKMIK